MRADQVFPGVVKPPEPGSVSQVLSDMFAGISKGIEKVRDISNSPHAAVLHAAVRQGADEIAQILPAFPDSNVRPASEPGQMFEPTQGEVDRQLTGENQKDREMDMDG